MAVTKLPLATYGADRLVEPRLLSGADSILGREGKQGTHLSVKLIATDRVGRVAETTARLNVSKGVKKKFTG